MTAYWDARAPHFDGVASHVRLQEVWREVLAAAFAVDTPCDVVDLGTGTGACAIIAAALGHRVRAFDGSTAMLAVARAAAERAGHQVTFVQSRIADAPIAPASADIVTLRNVLWTLERPAEALEVARRALRLGGRVVVSDGLWSHAPDDRSDYTPDVAARLPLHAGLSEADARRLLHDTGFDGISSWQHLFRSEPYPGGVPAFVLSAQPRDAASHDAGGRAIGWDNRIDTDPHPSEDGAPWRQDTA
ncbi:class I SAM-dependent methyltransferase [Methylobacterium sp. E-046]|uniref:class I SAM-dependent methyltransferase n=1 Tax=Methylobacterium sp. E-046 TaxID=2836576 RepID=UPI001FB9BBE8|nr:class I SAM-dependent methyltransferase [Methylobacterium sp. E-046]MCJ2101014.1 class I SAM-dependent methyltransferase [Methylobacterium sp. E-046]